MARFDPTEADLAWSRRILEAGALSSLLVRPDTRQASAEVMAALRRELDAAAWGLLSRLTEAAEPERPATEIGLDSDAVAR